MRRVGRLASKLAANAHRGKLSHFLGDYVASHIRTSAHQAVVAALIEARTAAKLTQRELAALLPKWLGWDHVVIAKAETNRRRITLPEVRELAQACGTTVAAIDRRAVEIRSALAHVPGQKKR
jgi:hypothetical protein